mmetsp:Transcript_10676/g.30497  ORF Transcript_10676/g.30497 Transcript_10676/m.30497 type:complete len:304 (-) Transcript_10676:2427-3338(-)
MPTTESLNFFSSASRSPICRFSSRDLSRFLCLYRKNRIKNRRTLGMTMPRIRATGILLSLKTWRSVSHGQEHGINPVQMQKPSTHCPASSDSQCSLPRSVGHSATRMMSKSNPLCVLLSLRSVTSDTSTLDVSVVLVRPSSMISFTTQAPSSLHTPVCHGKEHTSSTVQASTKYISSLCELPMTSLSSTSVAGWGSKSNGLWNTNRAATVSSGRSCPSMIHLHPPSSAHGMARTLPYASVWLRTRPTVYSDATSLFTGNNGLEKEQCGISHFNPDDPSTSQTSFCACRSNVACTVATKPRRRP